jgi:hypothetical protein
MKLGIRVYAATIFIVFAASWCSAAEMAVLRNGSTIRSDRHEPRDGFTRLYFAQSPDSYVDVPTEDILRFEADDTPAIPSTPLPLPGVTQPMASADKPVSIGEAVSVASVRNNIDPHLILSLIRAESAFHANAVSPKGARGLMQLMPQTASQLGVENAFDPVANVQGGTLYLRQLLDRYDNNLIKALAAYNAGPERVDQYRGVPPYAETRAYVAKIIRDFNRQKLSAATTSKSALRPPKGATPADQNADQASDQGSDQGSDQTAGQ